MTLISLCCTLPRVESDLLSPVPDSPEARKARIKAFDDDVTYPRPPKNNNINWVKAERSWSGNLADRITHSAQTQKDQPAAGKPKSNHRRFYSLSEVENLGGEPKLVRSSGVRRNWSFEDIEDNKQ